MDHYAECVDAGVVSAVRIAGEIVLDARHPAPEWANTAPVSFCADWRGLNSNPARETEVRLLWNFSTLYLRFACRYRELFVFEESEANGRRDHLWDRDVAEAFLQPDSSRPLYYKEFEVSPNGMWIDLDIGPRADSSGGVVPSEPQDSKSGLKHSVWLDSEGRVWTAELAIPMKALTAEFDPHAVWGANFFRVEGQREPRFYSAWRPTRTPQPNFHVPGAFGQLHFVER